LEQRFGVWSAMGGTGSIVKGMAGLIEGQGGKIECNAEVEEILVEGSACVASTGRWPNTA
jgi:phytoene desaturase